MNTVVMEPPFESRFQRWDGGDALWRWKAVAGERIDKYPVPEGIESFKAVGDRVTEMTGPSVTHREGHLVRQCKWGAPPKEVASATASGRGESYQYLA